MHKLNAEIRQYYIDNPESLETRRLMLWEYLEGRVKEYNLDHLMPEAFDRLDKMWKNAISFWVFPGLDDINKMLDEVYQKNKDGV